MEKIQLLNMNNVDNIRNRILNFLETTDAFSSSHGSMFRVQIYALELKLLEYDLYSSRRDGGIFFAKNVIKQTLELIKIIRKKIDIEQEHVYQLDTIEQEINSLFVMISLEA